MTNHNMYGQNHYWENHWQNPRYRRISTEQAISIALQQVPGHVVKTELEYEDGQLIYEIDIRNNQGIKYEVEIDAITGEIVKVKLD